MDLELTIKSRIFIIGGTLAFLLCVTSLLIAVIATPTRLSQLFILQLAIGGTLSLVMILSGIRLSRGKSSIETPFWILFVVMIAVVVVRLVADLRSILMPN